MATGDTGNFPGFEFHQNLLTMYGSALLSYVQRVNGVWGRLGSGTYGSANLVQDIQREITAQAEFLHGLTKVPFAGLVQPVWVVLTWERGKPAPSADVPFNRPVTGKPALQTFGPLVGGAGTIELGWEPIEPGNRMRVTITSAQPGAGTYLALVTTQEARQVPEAIVILHVL
jgi:hypothetical protein